MYGTELATKENILKRITEYDIFRYYINSFRDIKVGFKSELNRDTRPSCMIYSYNSKLYYKDFRERDTYDCFKYIMLKYGVNYHKALDLVNKDFNLKLLPNTNSNLNSLVHKEIKLYSNDYLLQETVKKEIKVQLRSWNSGLDKKFWYSRFGIGVKDLTFFDAFALKFYWIYDYNGWRGFPAAPLSYGYYSGKNSNNIDAWKIYQPYEQIKWLGNLSYDCVHGYKQLPPKGDILFITKSLKDVIVLWKLGYNAVCPGAEVWSIPENIMNDLKSRFKRIIVLYDNDETGFMASTKICSFYDLEFIFLPKNTAKDPSDYVEGFGYQSLEKLIKNLIENVDSSNTPVAELL